MSTRVSSKTVLLSQEDAFLSWKGQVLLALDALEDALKAPLPTTKTEYYDVKPGEPGYEDAMFEITTFMHPLVFKKVIEK